MAFGLMAGFLSIGAAVPLASPAQAQAADSSCGHAKNGVLASSICWIDMTSYNDTRATSAAGQEMNVALPGGYTLSFHLIDRPLGTNATRVLRPFAAPLYTAEQRPDAANVFGAQTYQNIPGKPVLYTDVGAAYSQNVITMDHIRVTDSSGKPVPSFRFFSADAEFTNPNDAADDPEAIQWTSDKAIRVVDRGGLYNPAGTKQPPAWASHVGCAEPAVGDGTTSVTCEGSTGAVNSTLATIVATDSPHTVTTRLYEKSAQEAVAFGIQVKTVDLNVSKQGPAWVDPGGDVAYNILVTNNGPDASSGWTATDQLPAGLQNPRAADAGCSISGATLTCSGGPLAAGDSHAITVHGTAPASRGARLRDTVTVQGKDPDPNTPNNSSTAMTEVL